ncbi:MAG: phosphoenolpyruvate carboxylase [Bdellovibrionota bacterium]
MTPSTASDIAANPHKPLRKDIKFLGKLLGQVIAKCESPALLAKVEEIRNLSKKARRGDKAAYKRIQKTLLNLVRKIKRPWPERLPSSCALQTPQSSFTVSDVGVNTKRPAALRSPAH